MASMAHLLTRRLSRGLSKRLDTTSPGVSTGGGTNALTWDVDDIEWGAGNNMMWG